MRRSPLLVFGGLCLAMLFWSLPADAQTSQTTDLIAGQHIPVGTFTNALDGMEGTFEFRITEPGWCLDKVHVYTGITPPAKAAPGRFPIHGDGDCSQSVVLRVPLGSLSSSGFFLAAHAEVRGLGGRGGGRETAWAAGPFDMPRGWGWYSVVVFE